MALVLKRDLHIIKRYVCTETPSISSSIVIAYTDTQTHR